MTTDAVLSLLRSLENTANRLALRVPDSSDYHQGRQAAAIEIRDAIRKAESLVENLGVEANSGMTLHEFAFTLKTMRELQELSRQAPQSQDRRAKAARYELRIDQLTRKIITDDNTKTIHLPFN